MGPPRSPIVVYLLHIVHTDKSVEHYIGSTRYDQFRRRMKDHAAGNAAKPTRRATRKQAEITLARHWPAPSRALEHALRHANNPECFCPVCRPSLLRHNKNEPQRLPSLRLDPNAARPISF